MLRPHQSQQARQAQSVTAACLAFSAFWLSAPVFAQNDIANEERQSLRVDYKPLSADEEKQRQKNESFRKRRLASNTIEGEVSKDFEEQNSPDKQANKQDGKQDSKQDGNKAAADIKSIGSGAIKATKRIGKIPFNIARDIKSETSRMQEQWQEDLSAGEKPDLYAKSVSTAAALIYGIPTGVILGVVRGDKGKADLKQQAK
ncbi:MAG: hypothetical protein LCH63_07550 [Candidatus Melainabacteria bacterium]|nr:hypothetical protein [Candidatus Melainabacteria bacterium]OPZ87245.1 MAG: hypothetical protein BWY75_01937 [bacterium ADurb.Bin425]